MPPKGVSMSTFLSLSSAFFLTFTLHAASKTRLKQAAASSELVHRALELDMIGTSASCRRLPLDAGAALRDVGDRDLKMAAQRNLREERFHNAYFRNSGIGKSANVILDRGKI